MIIRYPLAGILALALALAAGAAHAETIRLGTEGAYPPYNFTDTTGQLAGFEIDMGNELCSRMGVECEWVAQDWDGIIPALLNGRYDAIIAGMSITDERRERINFSQAYSITPAYFVAPLESELHAAETVDAVRDALDGKAVGVQVATIHQNFLEQEVPGAEIRMYDTQEQLNMDLTTGRIDAGLADYTGWQPFLESEDGADHATFGPGLTGVEFPVFGEGVGIGMRQDDTELLERFNEALCSMKADGTLVALTEEWFGFDASMPALPGDCPG